MTKETTKKVKTTKSRKAAKTTESAIYKRMVTNTYAKMSTVMLYTENRHVLKVIGESANQLIVASENTQWNGKALVHIEDGHLANIYKKCKESYELHSELEMSSTGIYDVAFKDWLKYIKVTAFARKIRFVVENWFSSVRATRERVSELQHHIAEKNLGIAAKLELHIANLEEDIKYAESELTRLFGLINDMVEGIVDEEALAITAQEFIANLTAEIEAVEEENAMYKAFERLFS